MLRKGIKPFISSGSLITIKIGFTQIFLNIIFINMIIKEVNLINKKSVE